MITVVTATYNRAYILPKLYESLLSQKDRNFEWIIVDDGSLDSTEELVTSFKKVGKRIIFHKQKHGGKHRAINWAVKNANGEYIFIVDSDDTLTNDAIQNINNWVNEIANDSAICGVAGLRISKTGIVWGGLPFFNQNNYIDAGNLERKKYNLEGDKAEVYKREVLLQYPFPEFDGEYFVTEAVVWDAIAKDGYKLRWYNTPIYICEYLDDGLTKTGANDWQGHINNYYGFSRYVKVFIDTRYGEDKIRMLVLYDKVSKYLNKSFIIRAKNIDVSIIDYVILKIICLMYRIKWKLQRVMKKIF